METNNNIVIISGTSGTGKDFLLDKVKLCDACRDVEFLSMGNLIKNAAILINSGDYKEPTGSMTSSSPGEILNFLSLATNALLEDIALKQAKTRVLNSHVVYKRNGVMQYNYETFNRLVPRDFIFIESDPVEILRRRLKDIGFRDRDIESCDDILIQQNTEKNIIKNLSKKLGARSLFLFNRDYDMVDAGNNVESIVSRINNV